MHGSPVKVLIPTSKLKKAFVIDSSSFCLIRHLCKPLLDRFVEGVVEKFIFLNQIAATVSGKFTISGRDSSSCLVFLCSLFHLWVDLVQFCCRPFSDEEVRKKALAQASRFSEEVFVDTWDL